MINYWLIAPGENAWDWDAQRSEGIIAIGWHEAGDVSRFKNDFDAFLAHFTETYKDKETNKSVSAKFVWSFYKEINIGDIIFARKGVHQIVGIGKVISDFYYDDSRTRNKSVRKVEWQKIGEWNYPGQSTRNTVQKLQEDKVMEILKNMNESNIQNTKKSISLFELLVKSKNLILHGAPGTGKTYMAKEIAKEMGAEVEFVQFHPSYDYTDFVEGLRPIKDEDGNVVFKRIDGVFKKFCKNALDISEEETTIKEFELSWNELIESVRTNLSNNKLTKIGNWEFGLSKSDSLKYSSKDSPSQYNFTITKQNIFDVYCKKLGRPSGAFQKDMERIVEYMEINHGLKKFTGEINQKEKKNFVFIIDEINRGELSKIFGELFFSIDPGYRGGDENGLPKGLIKTQYQNLIDDNDYFSKGFYIPDNVYIIGTMNDIDRSVESMDFAFRRRFTFKEITAKDTQEAILSELDDETRKEAIKRMDSLNYRIWHKPEENESYENRSIEGLSSAYHIGGAYFLKLKDLENSFENLWEYHLSGLLREYLRGMEDADESLEKLHKAYNLENQE